MKDFFYVLILSFIFFSVIPIVSVYGHGVGSEIFPPVELDGKLVSLEVSSTQNESNIDGQQISIALIDFDSKITLHDVTFLIKSSHGDQFLFEKEFQSNNGFIAFNFISEDTDTIQILESNNKDFFDSLLGKENTMISVKGPKLSNGGLYKFDISIITAGDYSKKFNKPLTFNAGISIPQTTKHEINHPYFGIQNIGVVTYYDEIKNFKYDLESNEITFSMPFDWSIKNINQTSIVHEEIIIPKTLGELLVSEFSVIVNGKQLSNDSITIDDFFSDDRLVHLIINQKELWNIQNNNPITNEMIFHIKPSSDKHQLSSVTENGQFRIFVSWVPEILQPNTNATLYFDITDIFLKDKPVSVNYDLTITQNEKMIFKQNGISVDSKENHNQVEFIIPKDISGIVYLNFENLGNNDLAKSIIPIIVRPTNEQNNTQIPSWIKNNAGWWADGSIDDNSFVQGIQFLIKEGIMKIPPTDQGSGSGTNQIPSWIKNNAGWWANEKISDDDFVQGMQFLVQKGILVT